jgi:hypothetical protein
MTRTIHLHHPLWTHLPALALWLATATALVARAGPDASAPLAGGLLMVLVSFAIDEAWARHEIGKQFNWLSLLDEIGLTHFMTRALEFKWGPDRAWLVAGAALAAAIVVELLRRPDPLPAPPAESTDELTTAVRARQAAGQPWTYWSDQCPRYARTLFPVMGVGFLLLALRADAALRVVLVPCALIVLGLSGGFRVVVTPSRLVLRAGWLGLPLLRVRLGDIADAAVHNFSPVAEFGGWGVRYSAGVTAFYLEGGTGVLLRTRRQRRYLIGTDRPERLVAVLNAARAVPQPSAPMPLAPSPASGSTGPS